MGDQVEQATHEALRQLLERRGDATLIEANTKPITNLGLASEDGVEFECIVETLLDVTLPNQINPFVDDEHNRPRTVAEIVAYLTSLIRRGER